MIRSLWVVSKISARNTRVGSRVQVRYRVARQSGWKLVQGYLHRIRHGAMIATSTGMEKGHVLKRIFEYPNSSFDCPFAILSNCVSATWHCHISLTNRSKNTKASKPKNRTTPEDAKAKWDVVNIERTSTPNSLKNNIPSVGNGPLISISHQQPKFPEERRRLVKTPSTSVTNLTCERRNGCGEVVPDGGAQ